ncbi:16S rRNA (adenine(1518)-N(6)/adenine(1519)-N(6))-dimethyltransferase RsmA [Desulfoplanes sp.]
MKDPRRSGGYTRPKKSLGQNFLIDGNIIDAIVNHLDISPGDPVFEIGPGRGALTKRLSRSTERLFVLEKDREIIYVLKSRIPQLRAVLGDGLDFVWERLGRVPGLKLVGNLPYNVASPLMWEIFSRVATFETACFMVQKEVAQRLVAPPGTKAYGGLSVWVQTFVRPKILFHVSPNSFRPRPRVDSSVVGFVPKRRIEGDTTALARTVHLLFQKRRKQLGTILKPFWSDALGSWLATQGFDRRVRPEMLAPEQFAALAALLEKSQEALSYQNSP